MPPKEMIPVERLLESYEAALVQTGYSVTTKLLIDIPAFVFIDNYCKNHGTPPTPEAAPPRRSFSARYPPEHPMTLNGPQSWPVP